MWGVGGRSGFGRAGPLSWIFPRVFRVIFNRMSSVSEFYECR